MSSGSSGEVHDSDPALAQPAPPEQPAQLAPPEQPAPPAPPSGTIQDDSAPQQPAEDPWSPPTRTEPGGFASQAPSAWSAPAEWTAPATTAQPAQPAPPSWPTPDVSAPRQPAGNGLSPSGTAPWPAQPAAGPSASTLGAPAAGQYAYPPAGQYGYPPAGQPGYQSPYYAPTAVPTNPVAIAALVCGILQVLGFIVLLGNILLAVPAVICGAIALRQIGARGGRGRGMAIAGLVLGIVGIVLFVLFLGFIILGVALSKHSSS